MNVYLRWSLSVAAMVLWSGWASAAESFSVVRVSDMLHEETYQVVSADELKQLQKQLALEERSFQRALSLVGEEWRKDEAIKTTPFPGGRLAPRKMVGTPESFTDRAKADARAGQLEERESKKHAGDKTTTKTHTTTKATGTKAGSKDSREADRLLQLRRAADLVAAKLAELTGGAATPAAGAPGADKKADDKKADDKKAGDKKAGDKPAADKPAAGAALNKAL